MSLTKLSLEVASDGSSAKVMSSDGVSPITLLEFDATGKVVGGDIASRGEIGGIDQTVNSLTVGVDRDKGQTYVNNTGKLIWVILTLSGTATILNWYINGVQKGVQEVPNASNNNQSLAFPVPNGDSYSVSGSSSITYWTELSS